MELTPKKILEEYQNNNLDKNTAIELLISLVENSDKDDVRIDSIKNLEKIDGTTDNIFKLCENLLISDLNAKIRNTSAKIIQNRFLNYALIPMKWALEYESDYECIITVIKTLKSINSNESKSILIEEIKRIKKKKYIDNANQYNNKSFRRDLKHKKIKNYNCKQLAEIIINFKTIQALIKKFYTVYYELENALVIGLDLSELGWNVNIWKQPYSDKIQDISEITGLMNLKHLKYLDLSNNRIKNIKSLMNLKELANLKISNNKIEDKANLKYLKNMANLRFLDLRENKIAENINIKEFDENLKILYKKDLYFQ
ncbi:MAG: leucine-rich repeat domain-containing protein [Promethearchaeota archaeon]